MRKVIDGAIGTELLDKVSNNDKAGLIGLCWMDAGARNVYTIKKPVHTIADLKGLKIRVIGNPMFVDMMNALGGNGVAMGYDQVFSALQTGVVDGAENNPPSYVFDNHYHVAKYYTLTQHLIVPEILVFSQKTWDTLSKDDQALIKIRGARRRLEERVLWNKYDSDAWTRCQSRRQRNHRTSPTRSPSRTPSSRYGTNTGQIFRHDQAHPGRLVVRDQSAWRDPEAIRRGRRPPRLRKRSRSERYGASLSQS